MNTGSYLSRHNGPRDFEIEKMLKTIDVESLDKLIEQTVPANIRLKNPLNLPEALSEFEYLKKIKEIASKNKLYKTYIGMGYYGTIMPSVIQRNILENPSWYTSYTPYQAEISQGRLEGLLNFQTMIIDLTGMEIANASLLDEATATSEAMLMMYNSRTKDAVKNGANIIFVDENIFPQTLDVIKTRALPLGIEVVTSDFTSFEFNNKVFGSIVQYPAGDGKIFDYSQFVNKAHNNGSLVTVVADIMSLVLLTPPGEWGADIVTGSTQRFGIPIGYGGPHAAYFATKDQYKRTMPGRIIGISVDSKGNRALRMALQTREQHIKREKATSNICTAQALLANMAGMYAIYHGPVGLKDITTKIHAFAILVSEKLTEFGYVQENKNFFDTLKVSLPAGVTSTQIKSIALDNEINLMYYFDNKIGISLDETVNVQDIVLLLNIFATAVGKQVGKLSINTNKNQFGQKFIRKSSFLTHPLFNRYHSETEMMRYIKKLERKDISLTHSMISLGSCTMKLNPATSMLPLSWMEFGNIHPFVPENQAEGYHYLFFELEKYLKEITGFEAFSFQPNSGAAGEYAGLMVIRQYHIKHGNTNRNVVLIPSSAHGTNPASAAMAGMQIIVVECDSNGNINIEDVKKKAELHKDNLSCFMVTYPSTHGVFESKIIEMIDIIHHYGGLVYMDGANMNAQVGLTSPARIGADVCHLNLHKTFAIPHGGGGPGVGPIGVAKELVEYLPKHPIVKTGGENGVSAVSAAPWGSASILTISHAYCCMLGGRGLTEATKYAILNANYIASALKSYYNVFLKKIVVNKMKKNPLAPKSENTFKYGINGKIKFPVLFH